MAALKCPRPTCSFLFDPTKVPVGATLSCPQCNMRFKLDSPKSTTSSAPEPVLPASIPLRAREELKPSFWNTKLPVYGLVALIAVGLILFVLAVLKGKRDPVPQTDEQIFQDHNTGVRPPSEPWERDRTLENAMLINLGVYKRTGPEAWFGYAAQKFDARNARKSELVSFLDGRLKMLCENLNKEERNGESWLGQPAVKFEFRGTNKAQIVIAGECLAVSVKGIAYYFFSWAAERDVATAMPEFEVAKAQIRTLSARDNWKETKPAGTIFASKKLDYKLTDFEGVWKEPKNQLPTDEDVLADLLLLAEIVPKGRKGDTKYKADLFAFVLPAAPDAMKKAVEFVKTRLSRNPEMFAEFVFEEVKDAVSGDDPLGEPPSDPVPTIRLKMTHPKSPDSARLIVVSAMASNGKVVAIEATCLWKERSVWERRLVNLAASLASTEKEVK